MHQNTKYGINPLVEAYTNQRGGNNETFKIGKLKLNKEVGNATIKLYETALDMGLYKSNASFLAFVRFKVDNSNIDGGDILNAIHRNKALFSKKFVREGYLSLFRNYCKK